MAFYIKKRKKFLRKCFVGLSLFSLGVLLFAFFKSMIQPLLPSQALSGSPFVPMILMSVLSIAAFKPLDRFFADFFDRYLFRKKSYAHILLMNLTDELEVVLDLQELANMVVNTFGEVLQLKTVALLVRAGDPEDLKVASAYGWHISDYRRVRLSRTSPLMALVHAHGPHVLVRNQVVQAFSWKEANQLVYDFDLMRASWVIPLFVKSELTGLLAFSGQRSDCSFDAAEFHFFREFGQRISKSIHNAVRVQQLKRLNSELQDAQSQMLQNTKLTAIEQLATGIAHEIHNPLTIISGKAQVLLLQRDKYPLDSRIEDVLKTIVKQTKRAADITRKLLMFSQSSGLPKEQLSLPQIIEDTLALVSYQTSLEGIRMVKHIAEDVPLFYGNVHELREVFLNLILNAVQAIGTEGEIRMTLQSIPQDQLVEIRIADTGKGILPENLDRLFNPFFTTRQSALGLGLFVTKQIIHHYGGSIRVESQVGAGSLFILRLPVKRAGTPLAEISDPELSKASPN